jgi:hypothetical protein
MQQELYGTLFFTILIRYLSDIANDIGPEVAFWEGPPPRRE